jgi:hypothetical protein
LKKHKGNVFPLGEDKRWGPRLRKRKIKIKNINWAQNINRIDNPGD